MTQFVLPVATTTAATTTANTTTSSASSASTLRTRLRRRGGSGARAAGRRARWSSAAGRGWRGRAGAGTAEIAAVREATLVAVVGAAFPPPITLVDLVGTPTGPG